MFSNQDIKVINFAQFTRKDTKQNSLEKQPGNKQSK